MTVGSVHSPSTSALVLNTDPRPLIPQSCHLVLFTERDSVCPHNPFLVTRLLGEKVYEAVGPGLPCLQIAPNSEGQYTHNENKHEKNFYLGNHADSNS